MGYRGLVGRRVKRYDDDRITVGMRIFLKERRQIAGIILCEMGLFWLACWSGEVLYK